MKRYVRAMGLERGPAREHVESYRKVLTDHIIECVVYKDSLGCYNHWIDEMSAWIDDVNTTQLKIKRNPPKFKEHEYKEFLFGLFGTTTSDARGALVSYKANNRDYPDFDIDRQLVLKLYGASQDLSDSICDLLSRSKGRIDTDKQKIELLIHSILDEYL